MKILIIDFETTGLNIKADDFSVLEFAYSYSEDLNLIHSGSFLIQQDNRNIAEYELNDITHKLLLNATKSKEQIATLIENLIWVSDVLIAWNGKNFDFNIILEYFNIAIYNVNPCIVCVDPILDAAEISSLKYKALEKFLFDRLDN